MSKHEHNECKHTEVKFCAVCDATYCISCEKEWKNCTLSHYWTGNTFVVTPTVGDQNYILCSNGTNHSHIEIEQ